jgi:hypothetical protein
MTKTIAERFSEACYGELNEQARARKGEKYFDRHQTIIQLIKGWLERQPENQKMFTLEEVEATAREAWHKGISESSQHYFFYHWWSDKKQELVK